MLKNMFLFLAVTVHETHGFNGVEVNNVGSSILYRFQNRFPSNNVNEVSI